MIKYKIQNLVFWNTENDRKNVISDNNVSLKNKLYDKTKSIVHITIILLSIEKSNATFLLAFDRDRIFYIWLVLCKKKKKKKNPQVAREHFSALPFNINDRFLCFNFVMKKHQIIELFLS